ncbi:MAG TPA: AsmA family protein [Gammaproteobacteria bacterium]
MGKILKILLGLILLVVLVVGAALAYVAFFVDPNDYRDEITAQVKQQTGRELVLGGDLGLSVFPWLGLQLSNARLSNAPGFGEQPFAEVGEVEIRLKLMPLLSQRLEMDTTRLIGLKVNLARAKDGSTNWDDLVKGGEPAAERKEHAARGEAEPLAGLAIGGIEIRDAALTWDDRQAEQRFAVQNVTLTTGPIGSGRPVDLQLGVDVSSTQPQLAGRIELSGKVSADHQAHKMTVAGADLKLDLKGSALPGGALDARLTADLAADMAQQTASINGLRLAVYGLEVTGQVSASKLQSKPQATGKLTVAEFALAELVGRLGIALPEGVQADKLGKARLETEFTATRDSAEIGKLVLGIAGGQVDASARLRNFAAPEGSGKLSVSGMNLRTLLAAAGTALETADPQVLTRADLQAEFGVSPKQAELSGLKLKLDDTTLSGSASVRDFARPAIRFALEVDAIDADRYLPPPAQEPVAATPGSAAAGAGQLPVELLRSLNVDGTLKVGQLKAYNLRSQNIVLRLTADGGQLRVNPAKAEMYDGRYSGNIGLDVRGAQPQLSLDESLSGVKIEPLLTDLTGKAQISGTAQLSAQLTATGSEPQAIQSSLNGRGAFAFTDGAIKGVNLAKLLRDAKAALKAQAAASNEPEQTDFAELTGTFTARDGVIDNRDLTMKSPALRVAGEGTADLGKQQVDYLVKASVVATSKGQGGKGLDELAGLTIPVRIKGALADPGFNVDIASLATEQVKERATKEVEKQLLKQLGGGAAATSGDGSADPSKTAEPSSGDPVKDTLRGLFKR